MAVVVSVKDMGAGVGNDDAAIFRVANDYCAANGGGTIIAPSGDYLFSTKATRTAGMLVGSQPVANITVEACLFLDRGVSLEGDGGRTKRTRIYSPLGAGVNPVAIIVPIDYGDGCISGVEIEGANSDDNSAQGIFFLASDKFGHLVENVEINDVSVHHVGSYGIGNNLQLRNVRLGGIEIADVGADGIDWKVRGNAVAGLVTESVFFEDVTVRRWFQRAGAPITPTGIGIRGTAHMSNIAVYDIPDGLQGIDFVGGIGNTATGDFRRSASMSSLVNWYCEGLNPKGTAQAVRVWASMAVNVGQGVAKWAKIEVPQTVTPYDFDDGSSFNNVVCIPAHGGTGFDIKHKGFSLNGCKVQSDKVYFDARRGNLTAGQTVFDLTAWGGTTTQNDAARYVVKNGIALAAADYTLSGNSMTLVTAVLATDEIMVIFPPKSAIRIGGDYCMGTIRMDRWCTSQSDMFVSPSYAVTANITIARDGSPLRVIGRLPTSSTNLVAGEQWNDAGTIKSA